jgi:hypothetical protein
MVIYLSQVLIVEVLSAITKFFLLVSVEMIYRFDTNCKQ